MHYLFLLLSDEVKKKQLLRSWALNWWDLIKQPIDDVYLYFGTKVDIIIMLIIFQVDIRILLKVFV